MLGWSADWVMTDQEEECILKLTKNVVHKVLMLSHQVEPVSDAFGTGFEQGQGSSGNALTRFLAQLSYQEKTELLALMWLGRGRGDEHRGDWILLIKRAKQFGTEQIVQYLASKEFLNTYLWKGMKKMSFLASHTVSQQESVSRR